MTKPAVRTNSIVHLIWIRNEKGKTASFVICWTEAGISVNSGSYSIARPYSRVSTAAVCFVAYWLNHRSSVQQGVYRHSSYQDEKLTQLLSVNDKN